jgi:hypothetical protein
MNQMRFFDLVGEIDSLVLGNPDDQRCVSRLVELITDSALRHYFFERLQNPEWIRPLWSRGFFGNPPTAVRDEKRGTIGFPPWPEASYLARMASLEPELVLEVILNVPPTDNAHVCDDLADAALRMPPQLSARLVERAQNWARTPNQFLLPEKLGSLVAHLARGGQVEAALNLARVVLDILPDPREEAETEAEDVYRLPPTPRARFDTWDYEEILKKDFPELVRGAGIRALDLLCDLLEASNRLSQRRDDYEGPEDLSCIWRRAIEDHEQNRLHTLRDVLVNGVRDAAELLAQENRVSIADLVHKLEDRPWRVFHRIALYLLSRFPDAAPDLIAAHLLNRSLFDISGVRHEYVLLLRQCFNALMPEQQRVILDWIDKGPDLIEFTQGQWQLTGKRPTDEDLARWKRRWQRDRLAWLSPHLSEDWKGRYEALVVELGEAEHPEFPVFISSGWVGPASPKAREDLQAMPIADIVEFLKTWSPSGDSMSPSWEGLGRILSSVVSQDPGRFAAGAERFKGLDPTYVRALLSGFREAVKQNRRFEWTSVLKLCSWVVSQPREIPRRSVSLGDADPDWGWTRKATADLLSTGFEEGPAMVPFDFRDAVWRILEPITDDPEPTVEYEARYGGSNMDPATLSINTTRGEAMHAVVRYGLWVRRHLEKLPDAKERLQRGFDEIPEVRNALERHLDASVDPSLAIRAVYGQWFPWLVLLDKAWARNNVTRIFPIDDSQGMYRDAAWETYIIFCAPYDEVFEVLRDQYAAAVQRLAARAGDQRRLADPDQHLAQHLMTLYWRGKLNMDGPEGLMTRFWKGASEEIRGHALGFIGRSLCDVKDNVPHQTLERMKMLWQSRLTAAKESPMPDIYAAEMAAFGWWFDSGKFEDSWAVKQLGDALKIARKMEREDAVVERLAALSQRMPLEAVQCLEAIAKGDKEGWGIYGWRQHGRTILSTALAESNPETRTAAESLVHYLGGRGYFQFGELLRPVPPAGG